MIGCGVQGKEHCRIMDIPLSKLDTIYIYDNYAPAMDELIANGVEIIVLGCTEIPLAITEKMHGSVPIFNTISILADACIKCCRA
jgi:aspartate/glutamate racemase